MQKILMKSIKNYESKINMFLKGDLFMPISEHWKKKLIEMGCEEEKIIVHRMGIDVEKFKFSERRKTGTIKILSVGRLVEKKGA